MEMRRILLLTALVLAAGQAHARAVPLPPAAIYTDPPADKAHPARMDMLHIPSGGVEINAVTYVPAGAGPHPVVVLLHGLPGWEKNLDIAQVLRRAGWTVVAPNYRGSWGSPGTYSLRGNLDDAKAVLAYVRNPANAARIAADPSRIVVMGHSMGGWVTAQTAAADPDVKGAVMISAADVGMMTKMPRDQVVKFLRENMETLAGVTPEGMAADGGQIAPYTFAAAAPGLAKHPLLVLTSDDGYAGMSEALAAAVKKRGGQVTTVHAATDHSWDDARIRLETEILKWLAALPK
jgi:pimeloyl-ACP methyl ester carboxylesterase